MIDYVISNHAKSQFERRGIAKELVERIIDNPQQIIEAYTCVHVYQSLINEHEYNYLVRTFVNKCKEPCVVITGYRTSKIDK